MTKILKYQKIGSNKYKIIFDNEEALILYEEVIVQNNLLMKKDIDNKQIDLLKDANSFYEYYYKTLNYIKKRMHSVKEVFDFLIKIECSSKDANEIIKLLQNQQWLDDSKYLQSFLNDNINLTSNGPVKIKHELIKKGFDDLVIDQNLANVNDDIWISKIKKIIDKYTKNNKYQGFLLKQKTTIYLINLGYEKEMFGSLVDNIKTPTNQNLLKKDYQKILNKYKNKYSEAKLIQVIKQKLYQKGYPIEEINSIIKE